MKYIREMTSDDIAGRLTHNDQERELCAELIRRLDWLASENEKLREAQRRDNILTDAMCEIYATLQGRSAQPIQSIVDGCIHELRNA